MGAVREKKTRDLAAQPPLWQVGVSLYVSALAVLVEIHSDTETRGHTADR